VIHDVNLVHGLLDVMGVATGEVVGAALFANGDACQATVRLRPGDALWTLSHLVVPKLADYHERVTLYFDDRIFELGFPSPYLNHQPTTLLEKRSEGHRAKTISHRVSYKEPFIEELRAWHNAIVADGPVTNTVEEARRDMSIVGEFGRRALGFDRSSMNRRGSGNEGQHWPGGIEH
jgi:hypothetical protein